MTGDFMIFGIVASVLVKSIVNVAKELGLTGKWPLVLAIGVGILLAAGLQVATLFPAFAVWYKVVITGLVSGLTAAEFYQVERANNVRQIGRSG
jgi:hypothetical protein